MDNQNFKNHARFVPGFHLLTGLSILAALVIAIILIIHKGVSHETVFFLLVGSVCFCCFGTHANSQTATRTVS
jgi:hypothetical protein